MKEQEIRYGGIRLTLKLGFPALKRIMHYSADRFSIKERGYVKPGYFADFTIFNEDALKDGTPDCGKSFGIEKVFINGRCVLEDGILNQETLGTTGYAMRA